ncbi:hsp70 family protein [Thiotrichales bacterium 19S3-7]|nr:hsp70 family protein [Thiotrichales bacterium 19S3-7]MCF6802296.1 hsp70 family protein [Thiotrichales bacterium 19S3-11]
MQSRFLVGIDLGTTNIALSYYDCKKPQQPIQLFKIPQIVAPGQIAELTLLPAYYLYAKAELFNLSDVLMPWQKSQAIIGHLAKEYASSHPSLSVSSAKSYLSHPVMDIASPFLPLGSYDIDAKISPFEVTVCYLEYLIGAWNIKHPNEPLEAQSIVITIPASFNDQARQFTLKAAQKAGLKQIKLVEEPIAAFYHWLNTHNLEDESIEQTISELALVLDIGGGTSDFSLIQLQLSPQGPALKRIATGKHLLVGGDNMDHFLLQLLINEISKPYKRHYQSQWLNQIQQAKETLLRQQFENNTTGSINVSLNFNKSKLIADTKSVSLNQTHLTALVNGFFPKTQLEALKPQKTATGLRQFGLAFDPNPKITEHIADFLYQNQKEAREALGILDDHAIPIPQVILFNGGIFHCELFSQRIIEIIDSWRDDLSESTEVLYNNSPSLAVAYGACHFLKAKMDHSLIISAGARANYFIQVADETGLCILAKGTPENHINQLEKHPLKLTSDSLLRFPLFLNHQPAYEVDSIAKLDNQFNHIGTVITEFNGLAENQNVTLSSELNEAGSLNLTLYDESNQSYPLTFNLTNSTDKLDKYNCIYDQNTAAIDERRLTEIQNIIINFFMEKHHSITLVKQQINQINGDISKWPINFARALWDRLFAVKHLRFKRPEAEQYFYYLMGLLLNPGFGNSNDAQRIENLYTLFAKGVEYSKYNPCINSFWVMWRRVAPALTASMQMDLYQKSKHALLTKPEHLSQKNLVAIDEKIRLLSVLEKLNLSLRIELGNQLLKLINKKPLNLLYWWALGRIGNRQPVSINPQELIPCDMIETWLTELIPIALTIRSDKKNSSLILHTFILIARKLDDDFYQLDPSYETKLIHLFKKYKATKHQVELIKIPSQLDASTSRYLYGNDLPLGLTL